MQNSGITLPKLLRKMLSYELVYKLTVLSQTNHYVCLGLFTRSGPKFCLMSTSSTHQPSLKEDNRGFTLFWVRKTAFSAIPLRSSDWGCLHVATFASDWVPHVPMQNTGPLVDCHQYLSSRTHLQRTGFCKDQAMHPELLPFSALLPDQAWSCFHLLIW